MYYLKFSIFMLVSFASFACDYCNMYLSINPNDYQHSISMINRHRIYEGIIVPATESDNGTHKTTHGGHHGVANTKVREVYNSTELWGKFFISERLQLVSSFALANNAVYENGSLTYNLTGISDIITLARYQLYNTLCEGDSQKITQRLLLGGGVKLPVGHYQKAVGPEYDAYIQSGTGSFDVLTNLTYLIKMNNWGLNVDVSYKLNAYNNVRFRFANRFNTYLNAFYQIKANKLTVMPNMGLYYEQAQRDWYQGFKVTGSGGKVLLGSVGTDLFVGKFSFNFVCQIPVMQNLYDVQVPNKSRWILGLNYYL